MGCREIITAAALALNIRQDVRPGQTEEAEGVMRLSSGEGRMVHLEEPAPGHTKYGGYLGNPGLLE